MDEEERALGRALRVFRMRERDDSHRHRRRRRR